MMQFRNNSRRDFGGRNRGFGRQRDDRGRGQGAMFSAVCDGCGQSCEVPFKPTNGRPVYCDTCFGSRKESGSSRGGRVFSQKISGFGKDSSAELKTQLELLNQKMDRLIVLAQAMVNTKTAATKEAKPKKSVKSKKSV
jgi:CxxC-x17-CxxC domain-containing protein